MDTWEAALSRAARAAPHRAHHRRQVGPPIRCATTDARNRKWRAEQQAAAFDNADRELRDLIESQRRDDAYNRVWSTSLNIEFRDAFEMWRRRDLSEWDDPTGNTATDKEQTMSHKQKLEDTAATLDEVAVFCDYLEVLAEGAGQTAKRARLSEQGSDLRSWAAIYRTAADTADA